MEKDLKEAPAANKAQTVAATAKCPVASGRGRTHRDWWPEALDISVLHRNSSLSDPMGHGFDYAKEFESLDLNAVIKDLHEFLPPRCPLTSREIETPHLSAENADEDWAPSLSGLFRNAQKQVAWPLAD